MQARGRALSQRVTPTVRRTAARIAVRQETALTALLIVQCAQLFVVTPLAARGLAPARIAAEGLLVTFGLLVLLVASGLADTIIAAAAVSAAFLSVIYRLLVGSALALSVNHVMSVIVLVVIASIVARAVFAPGPITTHRVLGAVVLYLDIGLCFSAAYRLFHDLIPDAFQGITHDAQGVEAFAAFNYFSLVTLTSTGFGDIVPIDPFMRSLANLEGVIGQLYPATLLARLVTLHIATPRR